MKQSRFHLIRECVAFAVLVGFALPAGAQTSVQTSSESSAKGSAGESSTSLPASLRNRKFEDDQQITDLKLRADRGSLSRYSFKGKLVYRGPSLGEPTLGDQPNPDGSVGNYAQVIKGLLTTRYRLSATQAISVGTGVVLNHPFHGMDRVDAKDPFITHDTTFRIGDLQMRSSPGYIFTTTPEFTRIGETGGAIYDNGAAMKFDGTRWTVAMDSVISYWFYNREYRGGKKNSGGDGLAQTYSLEFFPMAKYSLSERFETFLGYDLQWYNPRLAGNNTSLWARADFIRAGIAYIPTHEIYVAAYLDSYPGHMSADMTTLNCNTIFSAF